MKEVLKALWDIINYSNLFFLLVDEKMNIKLINFCLAKTLGFNDEHEPLGRCWLDFIMPEKKSIVAAIYQGVMQENPQFHEVIHDVIVHHATCIPVKWFNSKVNHNLNWMFSVGIPLIANITPEDSEDSIRSYFRDIITKDRTMINALRDVALSDPPIVCEPDFNHINMEIKA